MRPRSLSNPLLGLPAHLLAIALPGERLFRASLVARLQVKGVLLDVLDDVFLLHLALEPPQRAFDRLTFLQFHLGHLVVTSFRWISSCSDQSRTGQVC